jgi:hypothetical protein
MADRKAKRGLGSRLKTITSSTSLALRLFNPTCAVQLDSIGKDILDNLYVTLNDGGKYEFTKVQCMFGEDHKSELASLNKGVQIRVVGICHGKLGNVLLRECSIRP